MSSDTLKRLIDEYLKDHPVEHLPKYVAGVVEQEEKIRAELRSLESIGRGMHERHAAEVAELEAKMRAVRSKCPHHETRFYGDPAGGNGSYYECVVCGAEVPRGGAR